MALIERWRARMKIQVINLPFCLLPGYEDHVLGDLGKLERHMVFVNNETVNLAAYLAEHDIAFRIVSPSDHAVRNVFDITHLTGPLSVVESLDDALAN